MTNFHNIVVLHPGAIGDVVLASPVATTLRSNYPDARITYWTHSALFDLLGLCSAIDNCVSYHKGDGLLKLRQILGSLKADLLVDLAGSSRSRWLTLFSGAQVVRYQKQPAGCSPVQHAVDNFLSTLEPLALTPLAVRFPTLTLPDEELSAAQTKLDASVAAALIPVGLVPGVGKLRPNRAWIADGWIYLARILIRSGRYVPVLIGGEDERSLCETICEAVGNGCVNMAGVLSLVQTAAMLRLCRTVVSGDTGPAHIAVAVGTAVVGLYGPTYPERSGPYGYADLVVDQSDNCRCRETKRCSLIDAAGPGDCMRRIMLEEVFSRLRHALHDEQL